MKLILVVEDEPALADGLAQIGSELPASWEFAFAEGADAALDVIDDASIEIVVSPSRMGTTDMLAEARRRRPEVLRLAIEDVPPAQRLHALGGDAHDRLPRRGSRETLRKGLTRGCALQEAIHGPGVVSLVEHLDALPALPSLYAEFLAATNDPNRTVEDLGAIIAQDIALTAKVLQIVNSAMFGLPQKIVDPGQAATFLGLDMLRSLVLSVKAFDAFASSKLVHTTLDSIWQHSLRVGTMARAILEVERCDRHMIEAGFLAGMMHDCGALVLAANRPDRFDAARRFAERDGREPSEMEQRLFGASHAPIGGHLLARWGLPGSVVEAVAFHHAPSLLAEADFSPLCAVHVANRLARIDLASADAATIPGLDHAALRRVGRESRVERWIEACREGVETVAI